MDLKIPIVIVISVVITAGVMYAGFMQSPIEPAGTNMPQTESTGTDMPQTNSSESSDTEKMVSDLFAGTNNLKKISSQKELVDILETSSILHNNFGIDREPRMMVDTMMVAESSPFLGGQMTLEGSVSLDSESYQAGSEQTTGTDYSTTNIQVKGVDEPDYLKNDGKYVYIVSGNTLSIIDAYPPNDAKVILKISLDVESQYIQNMFLNGDRLVIFYNGSVEEQIIPEFDYIPHSSYKQVTHSLIIDVSDREDPKIIKDYMIDGYFSNARMIGDYVYFVTNSHIDYNHPRLPIIIEDSIPILTPDAYYFDNIEQFSSFNTVTAINIFDDMINSETYMMGPTGVFYMSTENIYITYQQNIPIAFYENTRDKFFGIILPLLPDHIKDEIKEIQDSTPSSVVQWAKISETMQNAYNQMNSDERDELFDKIDEALDEYEERIEEESNMTIIHKIAIDKDNIQYIAKGSAPGRLLNQFSMDEDGDRFRIATTTERYTDRGFERANAVFVLDDKLNRVGGLDGIAPDESIFSARFIGDRLYLVTFQQIDPFFVIDLSKDTPKILGELKIPGFSDYLHPYDEDHIIGVGRDTTASSGRVQETGVKIALFNVKDVSNPIVADDVIIGDRSTYSEISKDHKAFFFDKTRDVLSIPITGDSDALTGLSSSTSSRYQWSGFYVFDLDKSGFDLRGTITHYDKDSPHQSGKSRTFYIDDAIYTASSSYLKINSFDDLDEINSIKLKNTGKFISHIER